MNRAATILLIVLVALGIIIVFFIQGDESQQAVEEMIQEKVEERIQKFTATLDRKCMESVIEDAIAIVDSLLIEEARMKKDSSLKPPKPEKPERPEIKTIIDTVPIEPFLPVAESVDSTVGGGGK